MLPIDAAPYVLASTISRNLAGGVNLGMGKVAPSKKSPIGYSIVEQRYTKFLLASIYHDMWELIRDDQPIEVCKHSECTNLFVPKRKTREYCSDACRVANDRKRKAEAKNNGQ
jgi:predicted RNA-binding Zn ribbon-like protein